MKNLLLSNTNIDPIIRFLPKEYCFVTSNGFNGWLSYLYNELPKCIKEIDNIFIIFYGDSLKNEIEISTLQAALNWLGKLLGKSRSTHLWLSDIVFCKNNLENNIDISQTEFLYNYNKAIYELITQHCNASILQLGAEISKQGANTFYSYKLWYLGGIIFSTSAQKWLKDRITQCILMRNTRKKCLILDMDNTLWGNAIGEVGYNNIELSDFGLGARYKDFQKKLKKIKESGAILAVVTKNNPEDAFSAFKNENMLLQQKDFVAIIANWSNKAENIEKLVKHLNIGFPACVFIDDNPVERETVKQLIPEIIVPDFPEDSSQLEEFADDVYYNYFYNPAPTTEDQKKTQMYQENIEREKIKESSCDLSSFIKNLNIKITINKAKDDIAERISALSQKTNQFNTTGIKYETSEVIKSIKGINNKVFFTGKVKDRVGDNGLCIVAVFDKKDNHTVELENFFMSCRVMGRGIEHQFLRSVFETLKHDGFTNINAKFIKTSKNQPAYSLFENPLFCKTDDEFHFKVCLDEKVIKLSELIEVNYES